MRLCWCNGGTGLTCRFVKDTEKAEGNVVRGVSFSRCSSSGGNGTLGRPEHTVGHIIAAMERQRGRHTCTSSQAGRSCPDKRLRVAA